MPWYWILKMYCTNNTLKKKYSNVNLPLFWVESYKVCSVRACLSAKGSQTNDYWSLSSASCPTVRDLIIVNTGGWILKFCKT